MTSSPERDHFLIVYDDGWCEIEHPESCGSERLFTREVQDPPRCGFDWELDHIGFDGILDGYQDRSGMNLMPSGRYEMEMVHETYGWETPEHDYYACFTETTPPPLTVEEATALGREEEATLVAVWAPLSGKSVLVWDWEEQDPPETGES